MIKVRHRRCASHDRHGKSKHWVRAGSYRLKIVARNAAGFTSARSIVRFAIVR